MATTKKKKKSTAKKSSTSKAKSRPKSELKTKNKTTARPPKRAVKKRPPRRSIRATEAAVVKFTTQKSGKAWSFDLGDEVVFDVVYRPFGSKSFATPTKVLEGHSQFVQAVAFSPDGRWLASGSEDATVRIWDVESGTCHKTLTDHVSAVNCVAFTADGKNLLAASDDSTVKVGSVSDGEFDLVRTLEGHSDYVSRVSPAGPGRAVSASKDGTIRVWDLDSGTCLHVMEQAGWVFALGASSDGRRGVAGSDRNVIQALDLTKGVVVRALLDASSGHIGEIMGMTLAAENQSGVGHRNSPKQIVFAPDDKTFVSCESDVIVWDAASGDELARMDGDGWPIGGVAFIADRSSLERSDPAERAFIRHIRQEPDNQETRSVYGDWLEEHGRLVEANNVRRHGVGRHLFAAGKDAVYIFDLASRTIVAGAPWPHGDAKNVTASADGKWGACGSEDGVVGIWDLDSLLRIGQPERHLSNPTSLAISQDGRALTASTDRTVRLWSPDGKTSELLKVGEGLFPVGRFSPDGSLALITNDKGVLRAFDAKSGALRGMARSPDDQYRPFSKHVFLRDGRMLVGSVTGPLTLWTIDPPTSFEAFEEEAGQVIGLAIDEDGDLIVTSDYASGEDPMHVRLWSLSKRRLIRDIVIKADPVQYGASVALTKDRIIVGTSEGGVMIFDRDRECELLYAFKTSEAYHDHLEVLPNGTVLIGGDEPQLVDVEEGKVLSTVSWGEGAEKRQTHFIRGTTCALVYSTEGLALLDYARSTLSAFSAVTDVRQVAASSDGEFVVMTSMNSEYDGAPTVLRCRRPTSDSAKTPVK